MLSKCSALDSLCVAVRRSSSHPPVGWLENRPPSMDSAGRQRKLIDYKWKLCDWIVYEWGKDVIAVNRSRRKTHNARSPSFWNNKSIQSEWNDDNVMMNEFKVAFCIQFAVERVCVKWITLNAISLSLSPFVFFVVVWNERRLKALHAACTAHCTPSHTDTHIHNIQYSNGFPFCRIKTFFSVRSIAIVRFHQSLFGARAFIFILCTSCTTCSNNDEDKETRIWKNEEKKRKANECNEFISIEL